METEMTVFIYISISILSLLHDNCLDNVLDRVNKYIKSEPKILLPNGI